MFLGQTKAFGNIYKSAFESSKKYLECFFEKHLGDVFLKKKHKKFLDIPKIPICLSLNIYLFSLKHLFILFKNPDNMI